MVVKMVFWDEMWNMSTEEFENLGKPKLEDKEPTKCCGDWNEEGACNCKTKKDENKNQE
jgi:hypothetical protein